MVIFITNGNCEEVRALALDISKAYVRVWEAGIYHKLEAYGVSRRIFNMIRSILKDHAMRVVLNAFSTRSFYVNVEVLQKSILGPMFFLTILPMSSVPN